MKNLIPFLLLGSLIFLFSNCQNPTQKTEEAPTENWQQLFNGKDLTGWKIKLAGYPLGENFGNTFRVEDGVMKVSYDEYRDTFDNKFGHIFYEKPFSKYRLRVDYRFVGKQVGPPEGMEWAFKNNGVMFHSQSAESMNLDQGFPVSLEAQMLGGNGTDERPTGNLCTPGMHVTMGDTLNTTHCISSSSKTFHGEEWITMELIVNGGEDIYQLINGDTVMTYSNPVLGGGFLPENYPDSVGTAINSGYIALQSESHPIEFRKVEILEME